MNRIDYDILEAMKAVDKVAPELRKQVVMELGPKAEQAIYDHALEMLASMPPVKPAPEPRWTAEDRGAAAWQLEQAVRRFREYAGRDGNYE